MPKIKHQPLELEDAPRLRYRPLPAMSVADYIDDYAERLQKTGVFDHLSLAGRDVTLADARDGDLAAIGVLGSAFGRLLSTDGGAQRQRTKALVLDHCTRFAVQVYDESADDWVDVDSEDAYNEHLGAEHMLALVKALGVAALRPLWNRLASNAGAGPDESPKSSPSDSPDA